MLELREYLVVQVPGMEPDVAALIQETENKLFWVAIFPDSGRDAHFVKYDKKIAHGEHGIIYTRAEELAAYVSLPEEAYFEQDARNWISTWKHYLKNKENQEAFDQFVKYEKMQMRED